MKKIGFICIIFFIFISQSFKGSKLSENLYGSGSVSTDSLPTVLPTNRVNLLEKRLKYEAYIRFASQRLPDNLSDWETYRERLKKEIIGKTGIYINHQLPLDIIETGSIEQPGYTVKNIYFQTRPGIYATANLYVPHGKGPFPGVLFMCGHSTNGRLYDPYQSVAHSLALNGYVTLAIDPWGAGERSTSHNSFEYHGANLGASLMNIGESLMGMQISDNIRGIDLICSLPYVDKDNIGATGASGGGNQTMWVSAIDERIKAAVPVVSVGTFESYIMNSNCICEMLIDGLTFTEEAAVLALIRSVMPCNHHKDSNAAFYPEEMLRSVNNAKPIFKLTGKEREIEYRTFDLTHGYHAEDRTAMLGWFDLKLKNEGTGKAKVEKPFDLIPPEDLMTFQKGSIRSKKVMGTAEYCKMMGGRLKDLFLQTEIIDKNQKRKELSRILRINEKPGIKNTYNYGTFSGWERYILETTDNKLIPVLISIPESGNNDFVIVVNTKGKCETSKISIENFKKAGNAVVLADLSGTGELSLTKMHDQTARFHTLARSELWLGKTMLGEWVKELNLIANFLSIEFQAKSISIEGTKEAGLAGLFLSAIEGKIESITLNDAPVSYLFDDRDSINFYSMAIHLPGFLNWGDISLVTALSGKEISFLNPVTMSGRKIEGSELDKYKNEFAKIHLICNQPNKVQFK